MSCERAATRWTQDAKRRERKLLWSLWTSISLSGTSQDQDLTVELGLIDIFTNTQINTIGPFDWQYRGEGGNFCYCTSSVCVSFLLFFSTRKRICLQNTAVLSLYKRSRFVCDLHWFCFWQCLRRNLTPVLEGRFPEIESLNKHQSVTRSHKSHSANRT